MGKKIIGIAISAFFGVCVLQSLLALQAALKEKEAREAAQAEENPNA